MWIYNKYKSFNLTSDDHKARWYHRLYYTIVYALIALPLTKKRARQGVADEQFELGNHYACNYTEPPFDKVEYWYRQAAMQGHVEAKVYLAVLWMNELDGKEHPADDIIKLLQDAVEGDSKEGRYWLAGMYATGKLVDKDQIKAAEILKPIADKGDLKACRLLVNLFSETHSIGPDLEEIFPYLSMLDDMRYGDIYYCLAICYLCGYGIKMDVSIAFDYFEKAVEAEYPEALVPLMELLRDGVDHSIKKDYDRLFTLANKYADKLPDAKSMLGECYFYGYGVKEDEHEGIGLWMKAADAGSEFAMANLRKYLSDYSYNSKDELEEHRVLRFLARRGDSEAQFCLSELLYRKKDYCPMEYWAHKAAKQKHPKALDIYCRIVFFKGWNNRYYMIDAAKAGSLFAQSILASSYEYGYGAIPNIGKAIYWYKIAAEGGDAPSMRILAEHYINGHGVEKDVKQAIKLLKKASMNGDGPASYMLAVRYIKGNGVKKDFDAGYSLLEKALKQGYEPAKKYLNKFKSYI